MAKEEIKELVAVEAAEKNVEDAKAKKKAKVEARCAKRDQWKGPFKVVGKIANAYDREPGKMWTATLLGGAAGAGIVIGVEKAVEHFSSKADTSDEEISDEAVEAPFDE